jgi:hypothetical protein
VNHSIAWLNCIVLRAYGATVRGSRSVNTRWLQPAVLQKTAECGG